MKDRLIVALDVPDLAAADALLRRLDGVASTFKIGMELYYAAGPAAVELVHRRGGRVFLDLKLHDIPNTVAGAARSIAGLGVWMFNLHASGGQAMLRAGVEAARGRAAQLGQAPPLAIAVTVLTSLDEAALSGEVGVRWPLGETVSRWAALSQAAGCDGVVASPAEVGRIRSRCGPAFLTVTPGVRPAGAAPGDQRRVMTPAEAIRAGASYLVVGRPITGAPDPAAAATAVLAEMRSAAPGDDENEAGGGPT